ncbi:hypothetical protein FHR32_003344 [Streptosporangium album]|uniref:Uncharacterized protein n=1 Tax=Streptosporangium album TaxID=47479 RepID=A0A7W7RVJ1_9ACTN|nr:hypothetical protein [Streptosporangium album]MBB4939039.1 hypothetical protein [Streptosporangium album]
MPGEQVAGLSPDLPGFAAQPETVPTHVRAHLGIDAPNRHFGNGATVTWYGRA